MTIPQLRRLAGTLASLFSFARFASSEGTQYKISNIKLSKIMIVVTSATESTKASLVSWRPANLAIFMANNRLKIRGCRDPLGAGGIGGVGVALTISRSCLLEL
jgi:hypothetical protein